VWAALVLRLLLPPGCSVLQAAPCSAAASQSCCGLQDCLQTLLLLLLLLLLLVLV
jgi:hypothetical protein